MSLVITSHLQSMKRLIRSLFAKPQQLKQLNICAHREAVNVVTPKSNSATQDSADEPVAYTTDECTSCNKHLCLVCSEQHISQMCRVKLGINNQLGEGVLRNFNLGEVIKVDIDKAKCICGKPLGAAAAICAACGMASCSEQCHHEWEKLGNCTFGLNFYSVPQGFTMRSVLMENIKTVQKSKINDWYIANKSSPTMICAYASSSQPYIFLQRGYRNYGIPNPQLINCMTAMPRNLDYLIHFERRCDCGCDGCKQQGVHPATNCRAVCSNFELEYMKLANMKSQNHKQCQCPCEVCRSGVIFNTHRYIDCMMSCERSSYNVQLRRDIQ